MKRTILFTRYLVRRIVLNAVTDPVFELIYLA